MSLSTVSLKIKMFLDMNSVDVRKVIKKELKALYKMIEQQDPEEREAKRSKLEQQSAQKRKLKCENCNAFRILVINACSRDSNTVIFPFGFVFDGRPDLTSNNNNNFYI